MWQYDIASSSGNWNTGWHDTRSSPDSPLIRALAVCAVCLRRLHKREIMMNDSETARFPPNVQSSDSSHQVTVVGNYMKTDWHLLTHLVLYSCRSINSTAVSPCLAFYVQLFYVLRRYAIFIQFLYIFSFVALFSPKETNLLFIYYRPMP